MKPFAFGLLAAIACTAAATPASAAYIVNISQVGNDVLATGSGSINLTGIAHPGTGNVTGNLGPNHGRVAVGSGRNNAYSGTLTGVSKFGTGVFATPTSTTGLPVGLNVQNASTRFVFVPFGYKSGDDLGTSTALYKDMSFADFGVTAGESFTWTWGGAAGDSFTVNVLASQVGAVPEPATWAMMIGGFGMVGSAMRRRNRPAARFA